MAHDHPDAPKQFGIRLSEETMELVSAIQEYRKRSNQPSSLAAIVESAIQCHYARLVKEGAITDDQRYKD
jgi:NTP pyrophosphatase (non-canonical NTP hydrolase)